MIMLSHLMSKQRSSFVLSMNHCAICLVLPKGVLLNPSVLVTDLTYASLSIPQRVGFQVMSEVAITIFVPKPTLQLYQDLTANLSNVTNIQVNRYHCYSHKSWDDCDQSKKLCLCGKVVS